MENFYLEKRSYVGRFWLCIEVNFLRTTNSNAVRLLVLTKTAEWHWPSPTCFACRVNRSSALSNALDANAYSSPFFFSVYFFSLDRSVHSLSLSFSNYSEHIGFILFCKLKVKQSSFRSISVSRLWFMFCLTLYTYIPWYEYYSLFEIHPLHSQLHLLWEKSILIFCWNILTLKMARSIPMKKKTTPSIHPIVSSVSGAQIKRNRIKKIHNNSWKSTYLLLLFTVDKIYSNKTNAHRFWSPKKPPNRFNSFSLFKFMFNCIKQIVVIWLVMCYLAITFCTFYRS